jgi:hypothetical protein
MIKNIKIQTFIFAHEQQIILDMEANNKFSDIPNLKYVMVGENAHDKLTDLGNIIIEAKFENNLIKYNKNMLSFTGWQLLYAYDLIDKDTDYVNLFEYDIKLSNNFNSEITDCIKSTKPNIVGYITLPVKAPMYIEEPKYCNEIIESIKKHHSIDMRYIVSLYQEFNAVVSVTSNHTLSLSTFKSFMKFMQPCIDDIKENKYSGHQTERALSYYYLNFDADTVEVLPNSLFHYQLDTHQTQGIPIEKFNNNYSQVIKK